MIGGYPSNGHVLDSILVGYYEGRELMYAASSRAGFSPEFRRVLLPRGATGASMPVQQPTGQRWRALGRRPYGPKMAMCRWLDPFLVARSEFLEWTSENRLHHARFAGLRSDKDARDVLREGWRGGGSRELGTT